MFSEWLLFSFFLSFPCLGVAVSVMTFFNFATPYVLRTFHERSFFSSFFFFFFLFFLLFFSFFFFSFLFLHREHQTENKGK